MAFRKSIEAWLVPGETELTPPTRALLEKTIDVLPLIEHRFNMANWAEYYPGCGTVCCIGGTMEIIAMGFPLDSLEGDIAEEINSGELMFLTAEEILLFEYSLFYEWKWDEDLCERYQNAQNDTERTSAGVDAIKRFLQAYDEIYQEKKGA